MSGSTTLYRRVMRMPPGFLAAGYPLTVHRALAVRNNVEFMIEQSSQVRVNWNAVNPAILNELSGLGIDRFLVDNSGGSAALKRTWNTKFQHTWLRPDFPTGLDVEVTALTGASGGTYKINVRIMPASAAPDDESAAWFTGTASTSSAATTLLVDGAQSYESGKDPGSVFVTYGVAEPDGVLRSPSIALMRIEVDCIAPAGKKLELTSVYVKEFSWA